ncbi:MAG: hypothetical protein R3B46_01945 [Phycisphaerales bacterium]
MTADLPGAGDDQETVYTYGVVKGTSAGESKFAAGNLLQKVTYPDSASGTDVVTYAYNAQGQLIWQKDQAGNVIEFDYDTSGRREHQRVTTLAGGFDNAVLHHQRYDDYGRVETVAPVQQRCRRQRAAVDEVKFTYDDWGSVSDFEQDHNGLVGAGGSVDDYEVEYTYFEAGDQQGGAVRGSVKRLVYASTTVEAPRAVRLGRRRMKYADEGTSRMSNIHKGRRTAVTYDYMGLGTVVGVDHGEPEIYSHLYSTSGVYPNLDRFNRVTTSSWTKDLGTDGDFYDVDIGYDRNSNITVVDDQIHRLGLQSRHGRPEPSHRRRPREAGRDRRSPARPTARCGTSIRRATGRSISWTSTATPITSTRTSWMTMGHSIKPTSSPRGTSMTTLPTTSRCRTMPWAT